MNTIRTIIFFLCTISTFSFSQNLVSNGSFEILNGCPIGQIPETISLATGWTLPQTPLLYSPDIFTLCSTIPTMQVPNNFGGYQYPQDGETYAGIICYLNASQPPYKPNFREYICKELECTLKAGHQYYVGYYINTASKLKYAINRMGMKFTPTLQTSYFELNAQMEVSLTNSTFNDTLNWVLIADTITADGSEKFISIGNFNDDTDLIDEIINNNPIDEKAYYYIDNVFVIPLDSNDSKPVIDLLGENKHICPSETYLFDLSNFANSTIWQDSISSAQFIVSDTGEYTVQAYVDGCKYNDTIQFSYYENISSTCETIIAFPNVFTPNNDLINDLFVPIKTQMISEAKIEIFNRWGNLMYASDEIEKGWDGTINNQLASEGVYFWQVYAKDYNQNKSFHFSGKVHLFK